MLSVGLAVKEHYHEYDSFLNNKFIYASDLLIVIGAVIFIIAFFGCCGAVKENACMTLTVSGSNFPYKYFNFNNACFSSQVCLWRYLYWN